MLHALLITLQILLQVFAVGFSVTGWAHWIWRIPAVRRHSGERFFWIFLLAAGACVGIIGLQHLFYLGCRLGISSWFAFAAAAAGNAGWVLAWRQDRTLPRQIWHGAWRVGAVTLTVFLLQSSPLFYHGPSNYYGNAHIDQVNYVLFAQFITDHPDPFHATRADPGLEPIGSIACSFLRQRLGQSLGLSYLAVVSLSTAKTAYGAFSILMLSFGAGAAYVAFQALGLPRRTAFLAGIWWGLLPAITKMHLDGFLSQTCYAWTLPLGVALIVRSRRHLDASYLIFQTIYYAYVMSVYPEMFVISVAIASCVLVFGARAGLGLRLRALFVTPFLGLLGVGWYLTLFFATLGLQYSAAARDSATLSVLFPWSGTWLGWSETFFGLYFTPALLQRLMILSGLGVVALMALGLLSAKQSRRRLLVAVCLVPIGLLAVLVSAAVFPKYGYGKLMITLTPFWILLAVWGSYEARSLLPAAVRHWWLRLAPGGFIVAMIVLAMVDDVSQWRSICRNEGHLAILNTPLTRRCFKYAEAHKNVTYLVAEKHPILNAWLLYHCRDARTYVMADAISDLPPTPYDTFRVLPPILKNAVILSREGVVFADKKKTPLLSVSNPQGVEVNSLGITFYWLGADAAEIQILNLFAGLNPTRWEIHGTCTAGLANPSLDREISLIAEDGSTQSRQFHYQADVTFPVTLHAGVNRVHLQATHSPPQTVHSPADPRNFMIHLQQLSITPAR